MMSAQPKKKLYSRCSTCSPHPLMGASFKVQDVKPFSNEVGRFKGKGTILGVSPNKDVLLVRVSSNRYAFDFLHNPIGKIKRDTVHIG